MRDPEIAEKRRKSQKIEEIGEIAGNRRKLNNWSVNCLSTTSLRVKTPVLGHHLTFPCCTSAGPPPDLHCLPTAISFIGHPADFDWNRSTIHWPALISMDPSHGSLLASLGYPLTIKDHRLSQPLYSRSSVCVRGVEGWGVETFKEHRRWKTEHNKPDESIHTAYEQLDIQHTSNKIRFPAAITDSSLNKSIVPREAWCIQSRSA